MNCRNLNETTYNKIENVLEASKRKESEENSFYRSVYGPATLINNWLENRTNVEKVDAGSEPSLSEHMDKYRPVCVSTVPDRKEYYNKVFEGMGHGQELLMDHMGFSYYGNYVSTYDLCYNHLTQGICGPFPRHYFKGEYKPSTDLSLIYGNLTQWGLKEKIYKRIKEQTEDEPEFTTESRSEYVLHDMSEVRKLNDFPSFKRN